MSGRARVTAIQHASKEVIHRAGAFDSDNFARTFSEAVATEVSLGNSLSHALDSALASTKTNLFRGGELNRKQFRVEVEIELGESSSWSNTESVEYLMREFAIYAESQLARTLKRDRSEEFIRSQLQTHMQSHGTTFREAHEGSGQSDLIVILEALEGPEIIEIKVPNNETEFMDGLAEVAQYAEARGLDHAYLLAVDHCRDLNSPRYMGEPVEHREQDGVDVTCVRVRIAEVPPSKVGRARRRRN